MEQVFDVIVIGAGVAGRVALRTLQGTGAQVALVEQRDTVLSKWRAETAGRRVDKVEVFLGTGRVTGPGRVEVTGAAEGTTLRGRAILLATGSCVRDLGLDGLGVERDPDGFLRVDDRCRTRLPALFAAGDVTGPPFLAEKAEEQGRVAALAALGRPARLVWF